ncbi:MAG: anaerobic dehydrogenase [Sphingomonadales bacterium]|nr:anaerobic dehydrogenase [Sphingomonadales bacterium]
MTTTDLRQHLRSCPFCEAACGTLVTADHAARTITDVRGDPQDPFSCGFICPKAYALTELHSDPDRLRQPLMRRGRDFEEIGWDAAMDLAAERISDIQKRHGTQSIAYYFGNPTGHKAPLLLYGRLLMASLGSAQVYSPGTLDQIPKFVSAAYMFGGPTIQPLVDLDRVEHLIIIGNNPVVSQGSMLVAPGIKRRIEAIRARGGKVVVIDPRRTETAAIADRFVPIRPGTDVFLLLAMINVIARDGLIRLRAAEGLVKNLDTLLAIATDFPPERVAAGCGISADIIESLARDLANAPSGAIYGRTGTCTQRFGTATSWLIDVLNTITGNLDRAGGNLFSGGGIPMGMLFEDNCKDGVFPVGRWHSRVGHLPEAIGMLPTAALADEILVPGEGQVRGLITQAGNLMLSNPNSSKLARAFEGLEFMLSFDIYVNETTRYADLIIPGPSYAEHSDFAAVTAYESMHKFVKWGEPVFDPEPGMPHDWEIFTGIVARMRSTSVAEVEEQYMAEILARALAEGRLEARDVPFEEARRLIGNEPGPDRLFDILIRGGPEGDAFGRVPDGLTLERVKAFPHGLDLGSLDENMLAKVLRTPDRLVDLAPPQITSEVPRIVAALEEAAVPGSLLMIGRRDIRSKNAWMHNVHLLVKGKERCTALIHPQDAAERGILDGALIRVSTTIGAIDLPAHLSDEMLPGVVSIPHGWGHRDALTRQGVANAHPGTNANSIIDQAVLDLPSATTVLNGVPVTIALVMA